MTLELEDLQHQSTYLPYLALPPIPQRFFGNAFAEGQR